jgi:hypothetical protein
MEAALRSNPLRAMTLPWKLRIRSARAGRARGNLAVCELGLTEAIDTFPQPFRPAWERPAIRSAL